MNPAPQLFRLLLRDALASGAPGIARLVQTGVDVQFDDEFEFVDG